MPVIDLIKEHYALVLRDENMPSRDYLSGKNNIYVCGQLMDPVFIAKMLGHPAAGAFAVALNYQRDFREVDGKQVHFMLPKQGAVLPGMVWLDLADQDVARFEEYEQVPSMRKRVQLEVMVGDLVMPAFTYLQKD